MGSLYRFPRRLFWRRWQPKLSKLSQHFFLDLVLELSDSPHMRGGEWKKLHNEELYSQLQNIFRQSTMSFWLVNLSRGKGTDLRATLKLTLQNWIVQMWPEWNGLSWLWFDNLGALWSGMSLLWTGIISLCIACYPMMMSVRNVCFQSQ
jgi:hypothetical protein